VIGADNEQLGIMPNYEALRLAREGGLDLVEVAPNVRPPVCRLMDYGKWKYSQKKNVKKHHEQQTKEVRLRPKTDTHDREIKLRQAIKFFKRGDKVQFTMVFRGRERLRREVALEVFRSLLAELGQRVKVERPPSMDGRHMVMIMSAVKDAFADVGEPGETKPRVAVPPQPASPLAPPSAPAPPMPPAIAAAPVSVPPVGAM
jgi:translation initiation factor IF-3